MKVNWCDRSMFQGPCYCLVTTPKLFKAELKKMGVKDRVDFLKHGFNACCHAFECEGNECFIVCIGDVRGKDPIEVAGLIVHEATHIKQHVMRIIGEKAPSDEFEAYMMQNISANLMQCFVEQTK